MRAAALETIEKKSQFSKELVLVVDKQGLVGSQLVSSLKKESAETQIVFVSQDKYLLEEEVADVLCVPYKKNIPVIPDGNYSYIVIVSHGEKEIFDSIETFIKKAEDVKARFIFALSVFVSNKEAIENSVLQYKRASVIYFGELFGAEVFSQTEINVLLQQGIFEKKIKLANMGLEKIYPVFLDDVVIGILEIVFGVTSKPNVFFLFPKHAMTKLGFVRAMQRINPTIRVDFTRERKKETVVVLPESGEYLLPDNYPIQKKIQQVFDALPIEATIPKKEKKKKTGHQLCIVLSSLFAVSLLLLPFITTILFSSIGFYHLNMAKDAILKGDLLLGRSSNTNALFFFHAAGYTGKAVLLEAEIIGQKDRAMGALSMIETGKELALVCKSLVDAPDQVVLKNALVVLQKTKMDNMAFFGKHDFLKLAINTVDVLPDIAGFVGKREYVILFQNNMELRPGGGFIGSYGLLTVEKGRVVNFSIHDVYDADGQLKGHVEPPFPLRRFLPSAHWYLRDSNWDVDFVKSASASAYFLQLEVGKAVDGVFAIDLSFVKSMIAALGPMRVADYNETVSADNFYAITQQHAQKDFFPGSTQKKDFLGGLFVSLREKFLSEKQLPYTIIAKNIEDAIAQKHLLFAFANTSIQNVLTVNNMSSSLWDAPASASLRGANDEVVVRDFMGISEANLGVNKANANLSRKINQIVYIDEEGSISARLTLTYINANRSPNGDYKNYLRIILPLGSKLSSVAINDEAQSVAPAITDPLVYEAKNFVPPANLEVAQEQEQGKTIYGFLLIVPANTTKKITVTYVLPQKISLDKPAFTYHLRVFKQPGTDADPYSFRITYPSVFRIVDGKSEYKTALLQDMDFNITFAAR